MDGLAIISLFHLYSEMDVLIYIYVFYELVGDVYRSYATAPIKSERYHMLLRVFLQFYPPHMVQKSEEVWILGKNANSINAESGSTWRYYILYSNSQF